MPTEHDSSAEVLTRSQALDILNDSISLESNPAQTLTVAMLEAMERIQKAIIIPDPASEQDEPEQLSLFTTRRGEGNQSVAESPATYGRDAWSQRIQEQTAKMAAGPHLDDDGFTLVVPSEWYNEDARRFWLSKKFEWRPKTATWERDTRKSLDGETYSPQAWLTATRRQFYRLWPNLRKPGPPSPRRGHWHNGMYIAPPVEPVDPETRAEQQAALADLRKRQREQREREDRRRYVEGDYSTYIER